MPEPLGPPITASSPASTSRLRPRSATVPARLVQPEDVARLDRERAHQPPPGPRRGDAPRRARRSGPSTARPATVASTSTPTDDAEPGDGGLQRRHGIADRRRGEERVVHRQRRARRRRRCPPTRPAATSIAARRRTCRRSCAGSEPLGLEVGERALLVAQVARDREQEPGEREQQRERRARGECEHETARERIVLQRALDGASRARRRGPSRAAARAACATCAAALAGTPSQSSLGSESAGLSAASAVESDGWSAIRNGVSVSVGKRLAVATTRARTVTPSTCSESMPPGPAERATSGLAITGSARSSNGSRGRMYAAAEPSSV